MQKKIFIKCFPLICLCVNMTCLLPYLLKYSLVESDEIDTIYSPYLSNSTKLMNLFKLTEKNGELGFALLYKCLYDSRGDHHGHVYIVNKLRSEGMSLSISHLFHCCEQPYFSLFSHSRCNPGYIESTKN